MKWTKHMKFERYWTKSIAFKSILKETNCTGVYRNHHRKGLAVQCHEKQGEILINTDETYNSSVKYNHLSETPKTGNIHLNLLNPLVLGFI